MEVHEDTAAMRRLREGDDFALNELMGRWQEPLTAFLRRYTGGEEDAQDLAQETFVRVYETRERYDDRARFSTWLHTIALNLARNMARWKTRHPAVPLDAPGPDGATIGDAIPAEGSGPDEAVLENERANAVRAAVLDLPDELRAVVVFSEYEDRAQADIASLLGCTVKAVETRLYRARQSLRERLMRWLK